MSIRERLGNWLLGPQEEPDMTPAVVYAKAKLEVYKAISNITIGVSFNLLNEIILEQLVNSPTLNMDSVNNIERKNVLSVLMSEMRTPDLLFLLASAARQKLISEDIV